jgi:hypothetical protein
MATKRAKTTLQDRIAALQAKADKQKKRAELQNAIVTARNALKNLK